ncbi:hypothetical protein CTI12_AA052700 [Artemisia annua]|uniref:Uncharacterized protein n=1 Tax=Artemisia annua TaxID=35608 RepID=A0A2U1N6Q6_ARTAN|nr:hypothetical protein CTI12_AA052700 [Artemisia annua]
MECEKAMEELKRLEQVQNVILLHSDSSSSSNNNNNNTDSSRFLANFTLFMLFLVIALSILTVLDLQISSSLLEDSLQQLCDKDDVCIKDSLSRHFDDDSRVGLSPIDCEDLAMVSLDSMQRANSTLEDFCRSYFMFHEMDANSAECIFKYLPLLSFTESYIYQLDTINEKLLQFPSGGVSDFDSRPDQVVNRSWVPRCVKSFKTDAFRPLAVVLERYDIFTDRIRDELKCGEEYWTLERKLCRALTSKQEIQVEDVMKAIHLKSFDYRVLNLLLYQLNGRKINETHMEFLSVSEFLVEVSDDLFDYEDDVLENNFNILRMFVRMYGASVAPTMLVSCLFNTVKMLRGCSWLLAHL